MKAYREENIAPVHQDHDKTTDARVVVEVASDHENDRNDMVRHHLPVVLPPCLSIEYEHLVHVESRLQQVVEFDWTSKGYMGVVCPDIDWVEDVRGQVAVDILQPAKF